MVVEKRLNELFYSKMCMIFIVNDLESSGISILIIRSRVLDTVM